jgi:hypothetical protein
MGHFDQGARYATQADPEPVVARLLRGQGVRFRFQGWGDTRTVPRPGGRNRTADLVAVLTDAAHPEQSWGLILEFQSEHDPDKLDVTLGGDETTITRWKELAGAVPDRRSRADLGEIALVFAELAGCYLAWEKGLENWDMTDSQVVKGWIEKGEQTGFVRSKQEDILLTLDSRFPGALPPDIRDFIGRQESGPILREWMRASLQVSSMEDFIAVVKQ